MKKPSVHQLALHAREALVRFPWAILAALVGSLAGMYGVQVSEVSHSVLPMINLMLTAALGIPLFFAIQILLERGVPMKHAAAVLPILAVILLIGIYYYLPGQDSTQNTFQPYIRYAIYNACLHLFVSFSPFLYQKKKAGFWSYNVNLLIRILTSLLYALVLFLGIVMALLALHLLFDLDIDSKVYPQLFILIMGLFNTWVFLAGIPSGQVILEEEAPPKELKIFAQYVLLPLLVVYLLILYGYGAKIIVNWDWPRGVVSYLIICVAVLGISTFLFLYPYGQLKGGHWIRRSNRLFYALLIPLLVLLFLAVSIRLGDYGFTVNRYLVLLLGIWLALTSLYFVGGKGKIIFIPQSLFLFFLLASFGPWGAFQVSEKSQLQRLKAILNQAQILKGDKLQNEILWDRTQFPQLEPSQLTAPAFRLGDSLYSEVSSIMHYLDDYHGFDALAPWFSQDMDQLLSAINQDKLKWQRMEETEFYMKTIGLPYPPIAGDPTGRYYSFQLESPQLATPVGGYDYIVDFHINEFDQKRFVTSGSIYQVGLSGAGEDLVLKTESDSVTISLAPLMDKLIANRQGEQFKDTYPLAQPEVITQEGLRFIQKFEIHRLNFQDMGEGQRRLQFVSGFLLIKEK
jgi:hypothetical protein